jgi:hypothetical protein
MKSSGYKGGFRPFEGLKTLLENKSIALKKAAAPSPSKPIPDRTDPGKDPEKDASNNLPRHYQPPLR